ncbi:MAG: 50S ribosomal protein L25 [Flavobacteriales bacterium]|nr:50S ribosomal protein L25 [Flavobacteriales bacterium]
MNKVALSGAVRNQVGTKGAAQLRRSKRVPCVLYGGSGVVHFSVEEASLRKVVFTPEVNGIELDIDGSKTLAMVHQKQFHPLNDRVIHVDFMEMKEDREAKVQLSIRLSGQPMGVRNGGKLNQVMRKVAVKGLPSAIPTHLDVDVSKLDVNQSIHVSDLSLPGLTPLDRPEDVVASVKVPKKVEEVAVVAAPVAGAAPAAGTTPAAGDAAKPAADAKGAEGKPAAKK